MVKKKFGQQAQVLTVDLVYIAIHLNKHILFQFYITMYIQVTSCNVMIQHSETKCLVMHGYQPLMMRVVTGEYRALVAGENKCTWRKSLPQCHFIKFKIPHGLNPGLCSEKLQTNCLCYDTDNHKVTKYLLTHESDHIPHQS